ncbi:hypothetical protein ACHAP8_008091 [Fusarium lateritium]
MGRYLATGTPSPVGDDQTPPQATRDNICQFNLDRRNVQRGDVHPVEHRPLAMIPKYPPVVEKPTVSIEANRNKTKRQESRSKKQKTAQPKPKPPTVHSQPPTPDFESVIWPAMQEKVTSLIEVKVSEHMEAMLEERKTELESLTRPPLLKADSSTEVYHAYVEFLQHRIKSTAKNTPMIRKTEAVMSLAMDLEPGIEKRLREHLDQITVGENTQVEIQDLAMTERECVEEEELEIGDEDVVTIPDDDDSDYHDDPDDVDEEDEILPSIECLTPVTTPTTVNQLKRYEKRYKEYCRSAASEREVHSRVLSPLDGYTNIPNDGSHDSRQACGLPETPSTLNDLEETLDGRCELGKISNDKKRPLETTPTPTKEDSKRRCTVKHSPGFTASPASSMSSYFPSLEEMFSSSLGRQSSPATQPSPSRRQPSLVHSPTPSPAVRRSMVTKDISGNAGATSKPPVPLFGESPGLFVTPDPTATTSPFTSKQSASRSTRKVERARRESTLPTRFRETTADFEAMDTPEKLLLLFKMSRGKEG